MLTGKQKRYLRSLAVKEKAIFQIGKDGVSDNLFITINQALKVRELVKISVLKTCEEEVEDVANKITDATKCELVQIIGKTIVIYKKAKEAKILLP